MSEYIVDVGNADAKHIALLGEQATHVFGHPINERIVRCKNCKFMVPRVSQLMDIGWFRCMHFDKPTRLDGFCAWGEGINT